MSSVAVNCCSVPQKWPTMPSDVIYTITQPDRTLVVEDNERTAKAVEGTDKGTAHLNGGPPVQIQRNSVRSIARDRFTIPRIPSSFIGVDAPSLSNGSGDAVDSSYATVVMAPKAKLKSFAERKDPPFRHEYYHDASFLKSEVSLSSSIEPVEKDDEGDHRDDKVNPLLNDMKEGSSMYVDLPHKPQCTDLPPTLQDPLVDHHLNNKNRSNESPSKDKPTNNYKDRDVEEENSCVVDCLYYTLQCCDCSIM